LHCRWRPGSGGDNNDDDDDLRWEEQDMPYITDALSCDRRRAEGGENTLAGLSVVRVVQIPGTDDCRDRSAIAMMMTTTTRRADCIPPR
jgi:hypothetical protein